MFIVARLEIDVNLSKRTPSSILQKTGGTFILFRGFNFKEGDRKCLFEVF
jgi:hypothetical protein